MSDLVETHLDGFDWLRPDDVKVGFGTLLVCQRETDAVDDVRDRAAKIGGFLTEAGFNVDELAVVTPGDGIEMFVGGRSA